MRGTPGALTNGRSASSLPLSTLCLLCGLRSDRAGHRPFCEESVALAYGEDARPVKVGLLCLCVGLEATCREAALLILTLQGA